MGVKCLGRQASDGVRTHVTVRLDARAMAVLDALARRLGTRTRAVEAALLAMDGQPLVLERLERIEQAIATLPRMIGVGTTASGSSGPPVPGVDMSEVATGLAAAFGGMDEDG